MVVLPENRVRCWAECAVVEARCYARKANYNLSGREVPLANGDHGAAQLDATWANRFTGLPSGSRKYIARLPYASTDHRLKMPAPGGNLANAPLHVASAWRTWLSHGQTPLIG